MLERIRLAKICVVVGKIWYVFFVAQEFHSHYNHSNSKIQVVKLVEDSIHNETERLRLEEEKYEIDLRARLKREGRERIAERNARLSEDEQSEEKIEDESETCKTMPSVVESEHIRVNNEEKVKKET